MKVLKDSWRKLDDGTYEHSISDILLAEVSKRTGPSGVLFFAYSTKAPYSGTGMLFNFIYNVHIY
ncbi:hypothetical protein ASG97_21390 [Bacillus sp. Soil745]|nr:hypothetical protein ASG97_21390 [Bacillus sp. Soil745]